MKIDEKLQKWLTRLIVLIFIIIIYLSLRQLGIIKALLNVLSALIPLYIAIFISWLMMPVANFLHTKIKLNYGISCILAIIFMFLVMCFVIFTIMPEVIFQLRNFWESFVSLLSNLITQLKTVGIFNPDSRFFTQVDSFLASYNTSLQQLFDQFLTVIKNHSDVITNGINSTITILHSTVGVITQIGFGFLLSLYLMPKFNFYTNFIVKRLNDNIRQTFIDICSSISNSMRNYLKGLLLDSLILFIALSILFSIFFPKIGIAGIIAFCLIAVLFNIIPFIGPIIGAIPLVLVVFQHYGLLGMVGAILIICPAQFVESNFVYPRIMGNTIHIHPVILMVGLLISSTLFGFIGMFIATPLIAIIKIILIKFNFIEEDDL